MQVLIAACFISARDTAANVGGGGGQRGAAAQNNSLHSPTVTSESLKRGEPVLTYTNSFHPSELQQHTFKSVRYSEPPQTQVGLSVRLAPLLMEDQA